jgi:FkbM family methyltransferase
MIRQVRHVLNSKRIDVLLFFKKLLGIKTTLIHLPSGEFFKIRNIDRIGVEILKGHFEPALRSVLVSKLKHGMTVLDIGANIGYYTVLMASRIGESGRVIAFEPNPVVYEELKSNIELNRLSNALVLPIALSDSSGDSQFYFPHEGQEGHGGLRKNNSFTEARIENVSTDRLDEVLLRLSIKKVDLIKIDVEGAELLVIRGANGLLTGRSKPIIFFESAENQCASFGFRVFDVLSSIASFGYFLEQIDYGNWMAVPK